MITSLLVSRRRRLGFALTALICGQVHAAVDLRDFDLSVRPQDDFFRYVNGTWLKNTPIPPALSRWGSFDALEISTRENVRTVCEQAAAKKTPASEIERMVGDFYASGMDEAAVNAAGLGPLQPELDRLAQLKSSADVLMAIARLHTLGVPLGFVFGTAPDVKDNRINLAQLRQGVLGLPERDYYLNADDRSSKLRAKYVAHIARTFGLMGRSAESAEATARSILALETSLAKGMMSREALRDPRASYHRVTMAELPSLNAAGAWTDYFRRVGATGFSELNLAHPDYFKTFEHELNTRPVAEWQAYLQWNLIRIAAPYLNDAFARENFEFFDGTLFGTKEMPARWKRVVDRMDRSISDALGQLYVAAYFTADSKAQVAAIAETVRSALRERLQTLEWMDPATRTHATAKLDAMKIRVGYPDTWRDYRGLRIDRGPFVLNVLRANTFEFERALERIGKPVSDDWKLTAIEIRGTNNVIRNEILFPAGFLQPPLFDPKADLALNYGGIGAVIGHEITHGFDDQGRQFDEHGNLVDWWTPESAARFQERAAAIIRQFNNYTVLDGLHLNGERSQGENVADLGGVKLSYAALQKALVGQSHAKIDGFTPEQRFFINWAIIRRGKLLSEAQRLRVSTDAHAPPEYRANAPLSNLDEFAAAFDVPEGAPMRRDAANRVVIW